MKSAITEARRLVHQIAGQEGAVKQRIYRAHRRCASAFSFNRIKDFYYGEKRLAVTLDEIVELRRIASGFDGEEPSEVEELRERVEQLEALVRQMLVEREADDVAEAR